MLLQDTEGSQILPKIDAASTLQLLRGNTKRVPNQNPMLRGYIQWPQ